LARVASASEYRLEDIECDEFCRILLRVVAEVLVLPPLDVADVVEVGHRRRRLGAADRMGSVLVDNPDFEPGGEVDEFVGAESGDQRMPSLWGRTQMERKPLSTPERLRWQELFPHYE
jgi:hypothetical protein